MPSLPTRRRYASGVATTLTASINASATTITIADATGWANGSGDPFFVTIDPGTASEERVLIASRTSGTLTVAASGRGVDGTTAKSHGAGSVIWPSLSATDADEANAHVSATGSTASVDVHGLDQGSDVVGTTDTQTLTNKTLTAPTINTATINASTIDGGIVSQATISGAAIATSTFTFSLNAQTGTTYTLVSGDKDKIVTLDNASAITVTIPSGVFSAGHTINLLQLGAGQVTLTGDGTSTVNSPNGLKIAAQYGMATVVCVASNTFVVVGGMTA